MPLGWEGRPARLAATHHDVGRMHFAQEVRRRLDEVAALDQGRADTAG
ncbi:hypothetical protein [Streptomyces sp. NPDC057939]